jgi:hypothetical protein
LRKIAHQPRIVDRQPPEFGGGHVRPPQEFLDLRCTDIPFLLRVAEYDPVLFFKSYLSRKNPTTMKWSMEPGAQRAALAALMAEQGVSFAELSRVIGRNAAYLQQYVRRGVRASWPSATGRCSRLSSACPRRGWAGARPRGWSEIPRIDVAPRQVRDGWWRTRRRGNPLRCRRRCCGNWACALPRHHDPGRRRFDVADACPTATRSSSTATAAKCAGKGGIFVMRLDGVLMVKRLRAAVGGIEVVSDNPAYPLRLLPARDVDVVGRVAWLSRAI